MTGDKTLLRPWMKNARCGKPARNQAIHTGPGVAVSLTATDQTRPPQPCQPDPDGKLAFGVGEAIGIFGVLLVRGDRNGSSSRACGKLRRTPQWLSKGPRRRTSTPRRATRNDGADRPDAAWKPRSRFAGDVFVHSHSVSTYALCLILCPHRATTSLVEPAEVSAYNCIGCTASAPESSWFPP
jgi:hypothetical protein